MSVSLFGSCRINNVENNNQLNNEINYTHSTKEVLQQIMYLQKKIDIPPPYSKVCFRTGICNDKYIEYKKEYTEKFEQSTLCIIEICSKKIYEYNGFYLHQLSVDKRDLDCYFTKNTPRDIIEKYQYRQQTEEEIEKDIIEIKNILIEKNKEIILVCHYNSKKPDGEEIKMRKELIELLKKISKKHNIHFVDPNEILKQYNQEDIMKPDLGHYTDLGLNEFTKGLNEFIKKIYETNN